MPITGDQRIESIGAGVVLSEVAAHLDVGIEVLDRGRRSVEA
jgi:hypothetical protein